MPISQIAKSFCREYLVKQSSFQVIAALGQKQDQTSLPYGVAET
jgi:hypothetical protein